VPSFDDYRKSESNVRARLAALTGLIGVALAPAAIVLSMKSVTVTLIMAVIAVAAGSSLFGILTLALAKRARLRRSVSLGRMGGARLAGLGRVLGMLSLSLGLAACVALAVYAVMTSR
jgi:hypothetical protein